MKMLSRRGVPILRDGEGDTNKRVGGVVLRGAKVFLEPNLVFNSSEGCLPRELLLVGQNLKMKVQNKLLVKIFLLNINWFIEK